MLNTDDPANSFIQLNGWDLLQQDNAEDKRNKQPTYNYYTIQDSKGTSLRGNFQKELLT